MVGAEFFGGFEPDRSPARRGDVTAQVTRKRDEHEADGAGADDEDVLAGAKLGVLHTLHDTSKWFGQRGVGEGSFWFELEQIFWTRRSGTTMDWA